MSVLDRFDRHGEHGFDGPGSAFLDSDDGVQWGVNERHLICQQPTPSLTIRPTIVESTRYFFLIFVSSFRRPYISQYTIEIPDTSN